MGDTIVAKRLYRKCPFMLPNKFTLSDSIVLDMFDVDIILGMDWLYNCFSSIHYRKRLVKLQFPNEPILVFKGEIMCQGVKLFLF